MVMIVSTCSVAKGHTTFAHTWAKAHDCSTRQSSGLRVAVEHINTSIYACLHSVIPVMPHHDCPFYQFIHHVNSQPAKLACFMLEKSEPFSCCVFLLYFGTDCLISDTSGHQMCVFFLFTKQVSDISWEFHQCNSILIPSAWTLL